MGARAYGGGGRAVRAGVDVCVAARAFRAASSAAPTAAAGLAASVSMDALAGGDTLHTQEREERERA